jgi:hypothetical protein
MRSISGNIHNYQVFVIVGILWGHGQFPASRIIFLQRPGIAGKGCAQSAAARVAAVLPVIFGRIIMYSYTTSHARQNNNYRDRRGMMSKTISEKNTKTEIIEAYNEALAKLKEKKTLEQVQTIAVKAIEGASAQRIVTERVKET